MKKGVITDYRNRKKRFVLWVLIILFILMIPTFLTMIYVFRHVKYMGVDDHVNYPLQNVYKAADFRLNGIDLEIETSDGEKLWCSQVDVPNPKCVIIYLGAMKEPSVTYFYPHAKMMADLGYASFLLEVRSHGESSGRKLGLGYTEVEDVRALVEFIQGMEKYKDLPIILHGVSLGGTIAINATAQIDEVDGCIAMSPFASPDEQLNLILKKWHIPGFLRAAQRPFTHQSLRWIFGQDLVDNMTPLNQINNTGKKPVLVISARDDEAISAENTYLLKEIAKNAEFWIRESSDHYVIKGNDLRQVESDVEYCNYLKAFIVKIIDSAN